MNHSAPSTNLDDIDRLILWRLDLDARVSQAALAKELGLSKQRLGYRLKRLRNENFICGQIAIIDIHRLGLLTYRLYFKLVTGNPAREKRLWEFLTKHPNSLFLAAMTGHWDGEVVFVCRNFIHFSEIVKDVRERFGAALFRWDVSMTPVVYQFRRDYLRGPQRGYEPIRCYGFEPYGFSWDQLDFQILEILSRDCSKSLEEIAEQCSVAGNTIKARIGRLEEAEIVRGYRTILNCWALGRIYVKALLVLAPLNEKAEAKFYKACASRSEVVYLTEVLGSWQLELEAEVQNLMDLDVMVRDLRNLFPQTILDYSTVVIHREYKLNYLPSGHTTKDILVPPSFRL